MWLLLWNDNYGPLNLGHETFLTNLFLLEKFSHTKARVFFYSKRLQIHLIQIYDNLCNFPLLHLLSSDHCFQWYKIDTKILKGVFYLRLQTKIFFFFTPISRLIIRRAWEVKSKNHGNVFLSSLLPLHYRLM